MAVDIVSYPSIMGPRIERTQIHSSRFPSLGKPRLDLEYLRTLETYVGHWNS